MNFKKVIEKVILLSISMIFFGITASYAAAGLTPVGKWKTIDDEIGKPRAIVQIWEKDGELFGKLEKVFYQPGEEAATGLCDKCPGKWHNQKLIGMTLLWDFTQNADEPLQWQGGEILDAKTGKIYKCQMTLDETGTELKVRGYIGLPLIGRTQVWHREK